MKIIAHRGASSVALENTIESIQKAMALNVDAIEIDIRLTKDNQLVVFHDNDLNRLSDQESVLKSLTLEQLQLVVLRDGVSTIPSLAEAMTVAGSQPLILEIKDPGSSRTLLQVLDLFPKANVQIASFMLDEVSLLKELQPSLHVIALERTKPLESIAHAKAIGVDGIGLNFWLLNPLTYWLIKRAKLSLYVYTVNHRLFINFIGLLYPGVAICTDHPEWFARMLSRRRNGTTTKKSVTRRWRWPRARTGRG